MREKTDIPVALEVSGWMLAKDESTGVLKCEGIIQGYNSIYIEPGMFADKLIRHTHEQVMHLGTALAMAAIPNE